MTTAVWFLVIGTLWIMMGLRSPLLQRQRLTLTLTLTPSLVHAVRPRYGAGEGASAGTAGTEASLLFK